MPFGQSVAVRFAVKAMLKSIGAAPTVQAVASRAAGWATAALTFDHHSQVVAEVTSIADNEIDKLHADAYTNLDKGEFFDQVISIKPEIVENVNQQTFQTLIDSSKLDFFDKGNHTIEENILGTITGFSQKTIPLFIYFSDSNLEDFDDYSNEYINSQIDSFINSPLEKEACIIASEKLETLMKEQSPTSLFGSTEIFFKNLRNHIELRI